MMGREELKYRDGFLTQLFIIVRKCLVIRLFFRICLGEEFTAFFDCMCVCMCLFRERENEMSYIREHLVYKP